MRRTGRRLSLAGIFLACCLATVGCGSSHGNGGPSSATGGSGGSVVSDPGGAGSGGNSSSSGGSTGGAGNPGSGGVTGGAGNPGSGGVTGVAGASAGGMSATGGSAAGASGAGGGDSQGSAGAGGAAGSGIGGGAGTAAKPPAIPSAGCGQTTPETGSSTSPLLVSNHHYYVMLPPSYDATKPLPLIFVFHGSGDLISWGERYSDYERVAKTGAIRVYPHSSYWAASEVSFFMPLYDEITSHFCVDKARVFAAGSDSGGTFASILGCEYASALRGVVPSGTREPRPGTPDAAYPLDATMRTCTGQVTSVVVHGAMDRVADPENGQKTRDFYRALNHCGTETTPAPVSVPIADCVQYLGCDDGFSVYWCTHTDPTYADTNHGWPPFAASLSWKVFSSY